MNIPRQREHWNSVPSPALARGHAGPAPHLTGWSVPVEMAIACSRSVLTRVVLERIARGDLPDPSADVALDGGRFLALLTWSGARPVYLPLKVQALRSPR